MDQRPLGQTGINVSKICLGTMTWGEQNTQDEAFEQLDYALDQGINFIDTAEMYPVPPMEATYGATETIIGNWFNQRGNRDQVILASKVFGRADGWITWTRGGPRVNRQHIVQAIEDSLRRLQTDYIDLYQIHWPDRKTNYFGELGYVHDPDDQPHPLDEALETMNDLVAAGKIRHVGVSNETPWGVMKYLALSESGDLPRIASIQNPYSLLNRSFEVGLAEIAHREQVGLLAYSPLAFGTLSGKYLGGQKPDGARLTLFARFTRYTNPRAEAATEKYVEIARRHGLDPAQMALAFVTGRPFVTSNIIGATSMDQLRANIASADLELGDELLDELNRVQDDNPNPSP